MQHSTYESASSDFVVTHPLDPEDVPTVTAMRAMASSTKGMLRGIEAREPFDALMESVLPNDGVGFKLKRSAVFPGSGFILRIVASTKQFSICMVDGSTWEPPRHSAILSGKSPLGWERAHLSPTIDLLPNILFQRPLMMFWPVTADLMKVVFGGSPSRETLPEGIWRWCSPRASAAKPFPPRRPLLGRLRLSPVTDLTLSGATYETRAEADPYFTRPQVAELVRAYLGSVDPRDPLASPIYGRLSSLPPVRIHVGDDEVVLDDSRRYVDAPLPPESMHGWMCGWGWHMDLPAVSES